MTAHARAAPSVFPMPFHRSLDVVDAEEAEAEKNRRKADHMRAVVRGAVPA